MSANRAQDLLDVEIRIFKRQNEGYPVQITLDAQQVFGGNLSAGIVPWETSGVLEEDGKRLFKTLLADANLREAWAEARGQSPRRRIRLWIDPAATALHILPWELMQDEQVMLSANADTPLSRYLPIIKRWGGPVEERPIRVLVAISNPHDLQAQNLPPVNVKLEQKTLKTAFAKMGRDKLRVDFLKAPVTLERLEESLRQGYHILHFLGHGAFNARLQQAALYLQDAEGNACRVLDKDLASMLARLGVQPHLVFLAACQSATRSSADAFLGLGPKLVSIGVPAVIAMQDLVSVVTARKFTATFYRRLIVHGLVDLAANEARSTLLAAKRWDTAVPVLFMRLKSGQLWEPEQAISIPPQVTPAMTSLHQLPPPPRDFTGREAELAKLMDKISGGGVTIFGLYGLGGVGKTTLALKLAEELTPHYPNAQLYLDLKGTIKKPLSVADAMAHVIRAYDPTIKLPHKEAELRGLYNSVLHGKSALLLMDNAKDASQVESLIPPPTCILLVTARWRFTLPGLYAMNLDTLLPDDARALLLTITSRIGGHADAIAKLCGYLPLALRLAGSALAERINLSPANYIRQLVNTQTRLRLTGVQASLNASYNLLSPKSQRLWCMLSVFADTFDSEAAAAVWQLDLARAQNELSELVRFSLIDYLPSHANERGDESEGRYRLHDMARLYADSHLYKADRAAAQRRYADHYLAYANAYAHPTAADYDKLEAELRNILAAMDWVYKNKDWSKVVGFAFAIKDFFDKRGGHQEGLQRLEQGREASKQTKDQRMQADFERLVGMMLYDLGKFQEAELQLQRSLQLSKNKDNDGIKKSLYNLGLILSDWGVHLFDRDSQSAKGKFQSALTVLLEGLDLAKDQAEQDWEFIVNCKQLIGKCYINLRRYGKARSTLEECLNLHDEIHKKGQEDKSIENQRAYTHYFLGMLHYYGRKKDLSKAQEYYENALEYNQDLGDQRLAAEIMTTLAEIAAEQGACSQARDWIAKAQVLARQIGHQELLGYIQSDFKRSYQRHCRSGPPLLS